VDLLFYYPFSHISSFYARISYLISQMYDAD
jgi:hypothetical protein